VSRRGRPPGADPVVVPVRLTVFDFALPATVHFASQMNLDMGALAGALGNDAAHTLLHEHRFTPASVTWPSGFAWQITWDTSASPTRCTAFWDEPTESPPFSIRHLARRYLLGEGWNGVGFPDAMVLHFVDNATPRRQRSAASRVGTRTAPPPTMRPGRAT
jgi:hypothetical protein